MTLDSSNRHLHLSNRGLAAVDGPSLPAYLREHFGRIGDAFHATSNPDGYIPMCIAENRLLWDLLAERARAPRDVNADDFAYGPMIGSERFRDAVGAFLGERFRGRAFAREHVAALAGAGSVLETLFWAIADPGDGVLIPTPSYAGFWMDLEGRDELSIIPVATRWEDGFKLDVRALDRAVDAAERPIRALLFTSPNNPLGTVYTADEIRALMEWARARQIHFVADEIYAFSTFGERPFVSAASLCDDLGDLVHLVWAFSKDFGASGLRCGVLISENPGVISSVDSLAYWSCVSGDTQAWLESLITDTGWVESFLADVPNRLRQSYEIVQAALAAAGIAHTPAGAGFFTVVDLRPYLDDASFAGEDRLWRRLLEQANIGLTPGAALRSLEPGLFRLCFASIDEPALTHGLGRLISALPR